MPSKGRRPICATLGSFSLLQKPEISSSLLIWTSSCIRKNERGGGGGGGGVECTKNVKPDIHTAAQITINCMLYRTKNTNRRQNYQPNRRKKR